MEINDCFKGAAKFSSGRKKWTKKSCLESQSVNWASETFEDFPAVASKQQQKTVQAVEKVEMDF